MRDCDNCMWRDQCQSDEPCDHFSPTIECMERLAEQFRPEYIEAWAAYLREATGGL